ncbi:hypothetical protein R84981_002313 [Carnimonas sp. R-84981]
MGCKVHIHQKIIEDYGNLSSVDSCLLEKLKSDFSRYIDSGFTEYPDYFGRVAPYLQPYAAERAGLMHIHLALPPRKFDKNRALQDRKNLKDPSSDAVLVYCQHLLNSDNYLLLALLYPDGHSEQKKPHVMGYLAKEAEKFHNTFLG